MHDDKFVLNWSDERVICVSFNMFFVMFPKGYLQNKILIPQNISNFRNQSRKKGDFYNKNE